MKNRTCLNILLALLASLGLGALGGGFVLMISPDGELMGMPLSVLKPSPFTSFLIPGAILFTVLGIGPLLIIGALIKKPACTTAEMINCFKDMHWSWTFTIYMAFALMIWIQLEMVFIQAVHWLHTCYIFLAIIMVFVALLPQVRHLYQKKPVIKKG
ncbi:MAG: hypothetical protein WC615_04490 [Mucilaginibacter sp.]|jgi:hypothetical protein|uniref:hypothetical protein n=1 Tax=Mucilaginibacter sp. TaxID=1882438 RepID=UPI003562433A